MAAAPPYLEMLAKALPLEDAVRLELRVGSLIGARIVSEQVGLDAVTRAALEPELLGGQGERLRHVHGPLPDGRGARRAPPEDRGLAAALCRAAPHRSAELSDGASFERLCTLDTGVTAHQTKSLIGAAFDNLPMHAVDEIHELCGTLGEELLGA